MVDGLRKKMPNEPFKILRLRRVPSWNTTWLIAGIHGNPRDNHPDYPWSRIGSIPPKCSSSISMPLADLSENRKRHSSRFIRSWLVQTQIPLIVSLIIWNIGILDSRTPKKISTRGQGWPPAGPNITGALVNLHAAHRVERFFKLSSKSMEKSGHHLKSWPSNHQNSRRHQQLSS